MKKIILSLLAVSMAFAGQAYAGTISLTEAGAKVTIAGDPSMGNLEYNPSPGVRMACVTADDAYTIGAYNDKTTQDNGNEYAVTSNSTGYAMRARQDETGANFAGAVTATAGDVSGSWTWMGGSGS